MPKQTSTWNLKPLLTSDNDPKSSTHRKTVENRTAAFVKKWSANQKWLTDPKVLRQALDEYEHWLATVGESGPEGYYFWLRTAQNEIDPKLKAKLNQVTNFGTQITNQIQFFTLRLSKIPTKQQTIFLKAKELVSYRHFLERVFARNRTGRGRGSK